MPDSRRRSKAKAWLAGILITGALPAAACDSSGGSGPLGKSPPPSLTCAPVIPPATVLTYGATTLRDSSRSSVTISGVSLYQPHQLSVAAAWVVPVTGTYGYGVRSGWPPIPPATPGWHWSQRMRANGAHITRSQPGNLILVLKPAQHEGWAQGITVTYTAAGQSYSLLIPSKLVATDGTRCPGKLPIHL